ncbi:MAG: 3-coathanger stack domain-containing protein [Bacteroidota bacterium]
MKHIRYTLFFLIIFNSLPTDALWAQPACLGEQGSLKWLLWENVRDDELDDLTHLHTFPNQPDAFEVVSTIKSLGNERNVTIEGEEYISVDYGSYYGSMIRGYLRVGQSGNYTFNLTGDDEARFLLSTDDTRGNLVQLASVTDWTYREQYNKPTESNQTSVAISLQANVYYYFEVLQKEHSGGDHVEVKWKTPANTTTWENIPSNQLFDYNCSFECDPVGTPCDDGNAATENDQMDGFCNCTGTPVNKSSCVGKRGEIKAMYYLDISGNSISSFEAAEKYPLMPDTVEVLSRMQGAQVDREQYGTKISGFIKVPVSGLYQFNVTCDDRASFRLSTTDSPDQLVEVSYSNYSNEHQHYRYESQVQSAVNLSKDNFYYFEMLHRQGTGGDRFSAFWRTPFSQDTLWRYIDQTYIYAYECELACIPEGTPCDDGNNFTKDDQYDDECNCVGTPCRGSDCDDSAVAPDFVETSSCGVSEKVSNTAEDTWESCTMSPNPNAGRGNSHWIQYDLKSVYLLTESHIWNYNVANNTGKGFKEVVIDYSTDGTNWTQLGGIHQWNQATGTVGYEGFEGPNFNGVSARYILITALNNWDNNGLCSGFSKITFNATDCLQMGQSCDDGDANSVNDRYDEHCNCIGEGVGFSACGEENLVQENIILSKEDYRAMTTIESKAIVNAGSNVTMTAGESITLQAGFHATAGSTVRAMIGNCESESVALVDNAEALGFSRVADESEDLTEAVSLAKSDKSTLAPMDVGVMGLAVFPNPTESWTTFQFNLPRQSAASLCIYTTEGKQVTCLVTNTIFSEGTYTKEFPAQRLAAGMYLVTLQTEQEVISKRLIVIE